MNWRDCVLICCVILWYSVFIILQISHYFEVKKLRSEIDRLKEVNRIAKIEHLLGDDEHEKIDTKDDNVISGYLGKY